MAHETGHSELLEVTGDLRLVILGKPEKTSYVCTASRRAQFRRKVSAISAQRWRVNPQRFGMFAAGGFKMKSELEGEAIFNDDEHENSAGAKTQRHCLLRELQKGLPALMPFGEPPLRYQMQRRAEQAAVLLAATSLPSRKSVTASTGRHSATFRGVFRPILASR